jgi:UPF0176 protein
MRGVKPILNISAYRFAALNDTAALRESIRSQGEALSIKGTVLLAEEGINLFIAGAPNAVREFIAWLRRDRRFEAIGVKESASGAVPFRKLIVKVKREIIRMNHPAICPHVRRAAAVDARTVARWLDGGRDDAGRPVVTLDTRNAFEVDHGRFRGAIDWRLEKFSDFPRALAENIESLRNKTVVAYCTGGIRCEKAALLMSAAGVDRVFQLDGGILGYFQDTGGRHFDGRCFVFDERVTLDTELQGIPDASPWH